MRVPVKFRAGISCTYICYLRFVGGNEAADPWSGTGRPRSIGRPFPSGGPLPRSGCGSSRSLFIVDYLSVVNFERGISEHDARISHSNCSALIQGHADLPQHFNSVTGKLGFQTRVGCAILCHQHTML